METTLPVSILFGDGDLAATRPLRVDLRRRGAVVHLAQTASEVLRQTAVQVPALLVLDDALKQSGEIDVLSHFGARHPDTKTILLYSGGDAPPQGSGLGLLFSAQKPVAKESLLEVIVSAFPGRLDPSPVLRPQSHTVLCVDDDRTYLASLSRFLKRRGYEVYCHDNAKSALGDLPHIHPELAIVDIMMPGMDGLLLTRKIHEGSKGHVPVVVLTALDSKETYQRARESGATYCLTKPCKPEDFLNVVDFIAGDLDAEERELLRARLPD